MPLVHLPPLPLDRDGDLPLAVQLADALRTAAATGVFRAGDQLPSTRSLATELGVSRTVTAAAYDQLHAEGWLAGRHGAGTFVVGLPERSAAPPVPGAVRGSARAPRYDLRAGTPCVEVLDASAWRRAWRAGADFPPDLRVDVAGDHAFRAAVGEHLMRLRGLVTDPADVLATCGSTSATAELAATLPAGSTVAVENPGYLRAVEAFRARGHHVVPLPVDEAGLVVEAIPGGVAAVYCTPAHQYPMGGRLSAGRRIALVERARAEGFLVVEDDYDGELRYDVAPLPLLASLGPDVVAHLGTASKLLTPTLAVGWLVAPPAVRDAVLATRATSGVRPSRAGQRVFSAFAAHGDLARHLRRLRRELGQRRELVVAAVTAAGARAVGDAAGAHVVVPLPDAAAERAVVAELAARGVAADGLERLHNAPDETYGLVIGWAGLPRTDLPAALDLVTASLQPSRTTLP
jgi:GntR family transcriptional regulator / MocR family aminotransferase